MHRHDMKRFPLMSVKIFSIPCSGQCGQSKHTKNNVCLHLQFTFRIYSPISSGISFNMIKSRSPENESALFILAHCSTDLKYACFKTLWKTHGSYDLLP